MCKILFIFSLLENCRIRFDCNSLKSAKLSSIQDVQKLSIKNSMKHEFHTQFEAHQSLIELFIMKMRGNFRKIRLGICLAWVDWKHFSVLHCVNGSFLYVWLLWRHFIKRKLCLHKNKRRLWRVKHHATDSFKKEINFYYVKTNI